MSQRSKAIIVAEATAAAWWKGQFHDSKSVDIRTFAGPFCRAFPEADQRILKRAIVHIVDDDADGKISSDDFAIFSLRYGPWDQVVERVSGLFNSDKLIQPWYFGGVSRGEAVKALGNKPGSFLVRTSATYPSKLTVVYCKSSAKSSSKQIVKNVLVSNTPQGYVFEGSRKTTTSKSMTELIAAQFDVQNACISPLHAKMKRQPISYLEEKSSGDDGLDLDGYGLVEPTGDNGYGTVDDGGDGYGAIPDGDNAYGDVQGSDDLYRDPLQSNAYGDVGDANDLQDDVFDLDNVKK